MPLAGTFDVLDFGEILGLLSRRSATGRLQVRAASMHGTIWIIEGRATAAEIGTGSTGLGGAPYGEGRFKSRSLVEDICFDAMRSPRGSFEFHPEDETAVPAGPRIRLETVAAAGKKRLEMWHDVESVIHSFEAVPRLAEALSDDSVTLSQDRWRVLVAIDGRRNVAALARRLNVELLEFCQMLKPLVVSGAVVLDQPEGWLKSLPKVRLEVGGREGDPAGEGAEESSASAASGVPSRAVPDGVPVLNVGSTVVEAPVRNGRPVRAVPGRGSGPKAVPSPSERPTPLEAASDTPPRRRLRSRSRARSSGAGFGG